MLRSDLKIYKPDSTIIIKPRKSKLSGDMMKDMEIRDQIHNLQMTMNGVKPEDSHFDCIGCGS